MQFLIRFEQNGKEIYAVEEAINVKSAIAQARKRLNLGGLPSIWSNFVRIPSDAIATLTVVLDTWFPI